MADNKGRIPLIPRQIPAPTPQTENKQALLLGRYNLIEEVMKKGKYVLYRARDITTDKEIAIKEIDLGDVKDFKIFENLFFTYSCQCFQGNRNSFRDHRNFTIFVV